MKQFSSILNTLKVDGQEYDFYPLAAIESQGLGSIKSMPFSVKILLESLIRMQGHPAYQASHIEALAQWSPSLKDRIEMPYMPSRILLQDFTGVPCVVDLAALRSAVERLNGDPRIIEPQIPVDLIIDHSVQIDQSGCDSALEANLKREFERNQERYIFLRWGQAAFNSLRVLPPGLGICHQINMEYLAKCVASSITDDGRTILFPDTLVGTDSHTVMINSMGVLGWGVGGIEAEAAMLGQPIPILTPLVTGVRLTGQLSPGVTPTDLALTVTRMLREQGVVGQFVEFCGPGLDSLSLSDRGPVANMAPEYGATMGFFPIDEATLDYLRQTGRDEHQVKLVEAYTREQGLFRTADTPEPEFNDLLELDLGTVQPCISGPRRPHDRKIIQDLGASFDEALPAPVKDQGFGVEQANTEKQVDVEGIGTIGHGAIIIASITSCTNTSSPTLLLGAGIMARKATEKGLTIPAHVKTTLAPGSRVVTDYLEKAGLLPYFNQLGFQVAAYGCATCIGNSGPINKEVAKAIRDNDLVATSVLSGNRNFEGRIHPLSKANYLCSPQLVLAYAIRGTVRGDITRDPLGNDANGQPVYLEDIWPTPEEIAEYLEITADPILYRTVYESIDDVTPLWNELPTIEQPVFDWDEKSTYIQDPPFFQDFDLAAGQPQDIDNACALAVFGDFITTDHISPAGTIPPEGPAGRYLQGNGVAERDFNSFGSRRGNHEVMMRGTFANIRVRNRLVDREGGYTRHLPDGKEMDIYDAAMQYRDEQRKLVVLAGKMYGAGSSRDWAAKGTYLLGVKAVIAESYERIHRSNLVEMGVLPLEFLEGQTVESLGLTGEETFRITGIADNLEPAKIINVCATCPDGSDITFETRCRIDTPIEVEYYRHGGILQYVLRDLMEKDEK